MSQGSASQPSLCETLKAKSARTWNLLGSAIDRGHRLPGEEAFTDIFVAELNLEHPHEVFSRTITRNHESKTGADLELWFHQNGSYFGMLLQAKKLQENGRYSGIGRVDAAGKRQITKLIRSTRYGEFKGLVPLYLFYNGRVPGLPATPSDRCPTEQDWDLRGCTVANAQVVKKMVQKVKWGELEYLELAKVSLPWSCLVCCGRISGDTLPAKTRNLLELRVGVGGNVMDSEQIPEYVSLLQQNELDPDRMPDLNRLPGAERVAVVNVRER